MYVDTVTTSNNALSIKVEPRPRNRHERRAAQAKLRTGRFKYHYRRAHALPTIVLEP